MKRKLAENSSGLAHKHKKESKQRGPSTPQDLLVRFVGETGSIWNTVFGIWNLVVKSSWDQDGLWLPPPERTTLYSASTIAGFLGLLGYMYNREKGPILNSRLRTSTLALLFLAINVISTYPEEIREFYENFPSKPPVTDNSRQTTYDWPALVLAYHPSKDGQKIDLDVVGGQDEITVVDNKKKARMVVGGLTEFVRKATTFRPDQNPDAKPGLRLEVQDWRDFNDIIPFDPKTRRPRYGEVLRENKVCEFVDQGGRVVVIWGWHEDKLGISEHLFVGPPSTVRANGPGSADPLPVCQNGYWVFSLNQRRGITEAAESVGHGWEWLYMETAPKYYRLFSGSVVVDGKTLVGCGTVHTPPGGRYDWDFGNRMPVPSYCGSSDLSNITITDTVPISCATWVGCQEKDNFGQLALASNTRMWQNLPGRANMSTWNGKPMINMWRIVAKPEQAYRDRERGITVK